MAQRDVGLEDTNEVMTIRAGAKLLPGANVKSDDEGCVFNSLLLMLAFCSSVIV